MGASFPSGTHWLISYPLGLNLLLLLYDVIDHAAACLDSNRLKELRARMSFSPGTDHFVALNLLVPDIAVADLLELDLENDERVPTQRTWSKLHSQKIRHLHGTSIARVCKS